MKKTVGNLAVQKLSLFLVIIIINFTNLAKSLTITFDVTNSSGDGLGVNRIKIKTLPSGSNVPLQTSGLTTITTTDTSFVVLDTELPMGSYAACKIQPTTLVNLPAGTEFDINIGSYSKKLCDFCAGLTFDANDSSYFLCQMLSPSRCCSHISALNK